MYLILRHHIQLHKFRFLTSVYKQRFVDERGYYIIKVAVSRPTSNMTLNMLLFVIIMSIMCFDQKLPPFIKNYAKTWLKTFFKIALIRLFSLCVIYNDRLRL